MLCKNGVFSITVNSQSKTRSQFQRNLSEQRFYIERNAHYALHVRICGVSIRHPGNISVTMTRPSEMAHISLYFRSKVSILEDFV